MTNDISAAMPKILARGLLALREQAVMPRLVNGDYSADAAAKGDTVDIILPSALTAEDVTPGITAEAPEDSALEKVQIELTNWKKASFYLTDKEMMEVDMRDNFLPVQASAAIRALANAVNQSIHATYVGIPGLVGTAGTTPFAKDATDATAARRLLLEQKAPKENRFGVLDFEAEAQALNLAAFADADRAGSDGVKIDGEIGRKYGIHWHSDDHVPTHVTAAAGTPLVKGAGHSGHSLILGGLTTAPAVGDIFTIDGDAQQYAVTGASDLSGTEATVTLTPALQQSPADKAALTFVGDHVVNLVFNRDAFAFANRPLAQSSQELGLGNQILSMTDPVTGLSLRLEVSRQYKQVVWEFDILWGVALVRPALAVRLAG
ncbi:hypothetical protein NBZ79_12200 [Sneathiella marina]|uniref:P22 coat-protein 5 family protein n=1 Tax=Sneathiella marina TaxID=2950108 RepID=A0ABY4VYD4_9PROT|nr:P22 phage major capsid protein family protein [Sneathiella marina]USG59938.1 hypothetical protein NBZ79_12200 [Sneathiella marina]